MGRLAIVFLLLRHPGKACRQDSAIFIPTWRSADECGGGYDGVRLLKQKSIDATKLRQLLYLELLPYVNKPGQYVGNEINLIRKDLQSVQVRLALAFPDFYEVGMSYMGFQILYHVANQRKEIYAERIYAPMPDMEERMRSVGVPLFSLETYSPAVDFDVVGFTLQYEMHYTTILNMLDLAGIPLRSAERTGLPLVIAGGPSAFNPEPMADFFDAVVIGDGELLLLEIADRVAAAKKGGQSRQELLRQLAQLPGVYVPQFYQTATDAGGRFRAIKPLCKEAGKTTSARIEERLLPQNYPQKPLTPIIRTAHDRVALEIARGCSRGCRFCNAGMIYRPVRERSVQEIVEQAVGNITATGYDEVSLLSLSTSDYRELPGLMRGLRQAFAEDQINLSFPSLRPERFTPEVAHFAKDVRKSGLTLAPEAGSQRLRNVINKTTRDEDLIQAVDLAFREGWKLIKLYFMIGHPTEEEADLFAMVGLIQKVSDLARLHGGRQINISISPFIPKPFTPFQWVRQDLPEETAAKLRLLKSHLHQRNTKLSWREPDLAAIEGVLARGDRRLSRVIQTAFELGAKFEGWSENFNFSFWQDALDRSGLSLTELLGAREQDDPLPWDHIEKGIPKAFLWKEYQNAMAGIVTEDCRIGQCNSCGLMSCEVCQELLSGQHPDTTASTLESKTKLSPGAHQEEPRIIRIKYRRDAEMRYYSHLDVIRLLERALRRADVPVVFTAGYNPHPKISYGPSLATGHISEAEYFDLHTCATREMVVDSLTEQLPFGMEIIDSRTLFQKSRSLSELINRADYEIRLPDGIDKDRLQQSVEQFLQNATVEIERRRKGKKTTRNLRAFVQYMKLEGSRLFVQVRYLQSATIRIDELLDALLPDESILLKKAVIKRQELWIQFGELLRTPLQV